jgi:hypothetical protein
MVCREFKSFILTPTEYQHAQTRPKEVLIFFSCFFIIKERAFENHSHLKKEG